MTIENLQIRDITEREIEVIGLLAEGLTNSEIADRLFLSKNTIKWYVQQLNQKLFTAGREEIVQEAIRLGLIGSTSENIGGSLRTNLPYQTTPFVGRETELTQLQEILDDATNRLVTILAPGGMGKTRVALEFAQQQLTGQADGVYYVPLQSIQHPSEIITSIADNIDFRANAQNDDLKPQLFQFLSRKSMLLLLDNFEHVIEGATIVNELLQVASDIRLIVTSREKLNLMGETIYTLSGMSYPQKYQSDPSMSYDALEFVRQVARRTKPNWELDDTIFKSATRLCQLTQGMPLGILLAMSWLDVYGLDRICDEIQKSLDILSTSMRDVPSRQRSLRAIFDYSWQRLSPDEQDLLRKFSIFRGGCTTEAVEILLGTKPVVVQGLVMKALLTRSRMGRYEIHELLRQYAEEKLHQHTVDAIRHEYAQYYLNWLSQQEQELKDNRQIAAIERINIDWENVSAAWLIAIDDNLRGDIDKCLESIRLFALLTNRMKRYEVLINNAIDRLSFSKKDVLYVKLKIYKADTLVEQALTKQSFELLKATEEDIEDGVDTQTKALALITLSRASYILGDPEASLDYANACLEVAQSSDDAWHKAQTHYALCLIVGLWDADQPLRHIEQCIELSERTGDRYWLSEGYILGGLMLARQGKIVQAIAYTEKALQVAQELNNKHAIAGASVNLGAFARSQGDWERAEKLLDNGLRLQQEMGYAPESLISIQVRLSELYLLQGDIESADDYLQLAGKSLYDVEYPAAISRYYSQKSMMAEYQGLYEEAYRLASKAMEYIQTNMNWSIVHYATQRLVWSYCCLDAYDEVQPYLVNVTRQELRSNRSWGMVRNVAFLSLCVAHAGDLERANAMLGLVDQHDIQSVWLQNHPKLAAHRQMLREHLDDDTYNQTWQRGKDDDVRVVLQEWLREFDPNYSDS